MTKTSLFISLLILVSCNNQEPTSHTETTVLAEDTVVEKIDTSTFIDSMEIWNANSRKEEKQFYINYMDGWNANPETKPKKFPWKVGNKIIVYKVEPVGEQKGTWQARMSLGKEISQEQYEEYCEVLNQRDSYDNTTASCFYPKLSIVVYDDNDVPMEYSEICLDCNSARTFPHELDFNINTDFYGFSTEARYELRRIFKDWGVPYESYSSSWDKEEDYFRYRDSMQNVVKNYR